MPNIFTFQHYDWPWRNCSGSPPILVIIVPLCPYLMQEIFRLWSMHSLHLLIDNSNALLAGFPATFINCLATMQKYSCKTLNMHFARTYHSTYTFTWCLIVHFHCESLGLLFILTSWPHTCGYKPHSPLLSPSAYFLAELL